MNTDISLLQRFQIAIETLATGKGDVRSRLNDIVSVLSCIRTDDLPPKFHKEWSAMWSRLSEYDPAWEQDSGASASLRKIKNSTGQKMAKLIYDIWKHLEKCNKP